MIKAWINKQKIKSSIKTIEKQKKKDTEDKKVEQEKKAKDFLAMLMTIISRLGLNGFHNHLYNEAVVNGYYSKMSGDDSLGFDNSYLSAEFLFKKIINKKDFEFRIKKNIKEKAAFILTINQSNIEITQKDFFFSDDYYFLREEIRLIYEEMTSKGDEVFKEIKNFNQMAKDKKQEDLLDQLTHNYPVEAKKEMTAMIKKVLELEKQKEELKVSSF